MVLGNISEFFGLHKDTDLKPPKKDLVSSERRSSFASALTARLDEFVHNRFVSRGYKDQNASYLDMYLELQEWAATLFAKEPEKVAAVETILAQGKLSEHYVPRQLPGRWNYMDPIYFRQVVAELFLQNPSLAEALLSTKSIGGHGTKSSTLVDVLLHGLRPRDILAEKNVKVTSGEALYAAEGLNREYLSAAQWTDRKTLRNYAEGDLSGRLSIKVVTKALQEAYDQQNKPTSEHILPGLKAKIKGLENLLAILSQPPKTPEDRLRQYFTRENFPVIYMFASKNRNYDTTQEQEAREIFVPVSDISSEFVVKDGVSTDQITVVLLPKQYIPKVRQIIQTLTPELAASLQLFPLEDYKRLNLQRKLYPEATQQK